MEIVPWLGERQLDFRRVEVRVTPADAQRFQGLVQASRETITKVANSAEYAVATQCAGQLKGALTEIAAAKRLANEPFKAVQTAISRKAAELTEMVEQEHVRVLTMLNRYVKRLEAERAEQERKHREELAQKEAEIAAAKSEAERAKHELELELASMDEEPRKGLVPGGRVDHIFKFKLTDLAAVIRAGKLGLLRWEVDHYACLDDCRNQLAKDPSREPTLPGIEVSREINVSVRARK